MDQEREGEPLPASDGVPRLEFRDLLLAPCIVAVGLGQLDLDTGGRVGRDHLLRHRPLQERPDRQQADSPHDGRRYILQKPLDVFAIEQRDRVVADEPAEFFEDRAAERAGAVAELHERNRVEIQRYRGVDRSGAGARLHFGGDGRGLLATQSGVIRDQKFWRPDRAGQADARITAPAKEPYVRPVFRSIQLLTYFILIRMLFWSFMVCRSATRPAHCRTRRVPRPRAPPSSDGPRTGGDGGKIWRTIRALAGVE
jgi:hypothetical protein